MPFVTIRHFAEADVPLRTELLRESVFQANLTDFAAASADDALAANQRRTLTEEHDTKRIFTFCGKDGEVIGFAWITLIDWRSQVCELSFGLLPRFRGPYGLTAVALADSHLRTELNMKVVINQVLDHNHMLQAEELVAAARRVHCEYDSYTVGEWRAAGYWTHTEQDMLDSGRRVEERRRAVAERIRAKTRQTQRTS